MILFTILNTTFVLIYEFNYFLCQLMNLINKFIFNQILSRCYLHHDNYNFTLLALAGFGLIFEIITFFVSSERSSQRLSGVFICFTQLLIYCGSIIDLRMANQKSVMVSKLYLVVLYAIATSCIYYYIEHREQSYLSNADEFRVFKKVQKKTDQL